MRGLIRRLPILTVPLLVITFAGSARAQDPQTVPPETPSVLLEREAAYCASLAEPVRRQTEICKTDEERRDDEYAARMKAKAEQEANKHTSFLRWVHTDALWVPGDTGNSTYGLIGMHLAVARVGRLDLYGPPGVILLRQATGTGWMYRPGFTWGVSVFLADLRVPGIGKRARLYADVSKCWTQGDDRTSFSMLGFSLTWKK